jgi:head-tail adaptor
MQAAVLSERIYIEKYTQSVDSMGTPTHQWVPLYEMAAAVEYGSGNQTYSPTPQQNVHSYVQSFSIRYRPEIDYNIRIKHEGIYFYPLSIEKLRRRDGYKIICERRENE